MNYIEEFFRNCDSVRDEVAKDRIIQKRIRQLKEHGGWDHRGSGNADYSSLKKLKLGLKGRIKDLNYHKVEAPMAAYLWQPDIPVTSFVVVVGETGSSLFYLVEDFGQLVDRPSDLLSQREQAVEMQYLSPESRRLLEEIDEEEKRIMSHTESKGIEVNEMAMGYPVDNEKWTVVLHDLDPGASYTGKFDDPNGGWFDTFNGKKTKFSKLIKIYDRIMLPENRLDL